MSHHLDSPASRRDPRLNTTDTYVFDGVRGTVLVMLTGSSLAGDTAPAGFHPEGRYEFKLHLDGEPLERRTYRFTFGERDAEGQQVMTLHEVTGEAARSDAAPGRQVARGATGAPVRGEGGVGIRAWAGRVRDPFYLDLQQLPSVIEGLQHGRAISYGEWAPESARNSFEGAHVSAIVLEVETDDPELRPGRQIAVWSATALRTDAGGWRQTNRSAIPMMWPLFRAVGADDDSDRYLAATTAHPADDRADEGDRVRDLIRAAARHTGTERAHDHADLVTSRLLPDVLPYRVGTPAAFGFAGFNGRALADNAPEVMYALITNSAVPTGLTSAVAAGARAGEFPYVVPAT